MFHNILVAVDGSADADAALTHAIDLAESEHTRLTLITAVAQLPPTAYLIPGEETGQLSESAHRQAEAIIRQARDRVPADLPVTTVLSDQPIRLATTLETSIEIPVNAKPPCLKVVWVIALT